MLTFHRVNLLRNIIVARCFFLKKTIVFLSNLKTIIIYNPYQVVLKLSLAIIPHLFYFIPELYQLRNVFSEKHYLSFPFKNFDKIDPIQGSIHTSSILLKPGQLHNFLMTFPFLIIVKEHVVGNLHRPCPI